MKCKTLVRENIRGCEVEIFQNVDSTLQSFYEKDGIKHSTMGQSVGEIVGRLSSQLGLPDQSRKLLTSKIVEAL